MSHGPIGRLGRFTATHVRAVVLGWVLVTVVLEFFAPSAETALSSAGWDMLVTVAGTVATGNLGVGVGVGLGVLTAMLAFATACADDRARLVGAANIGWIGAIKVADHELCSPC